jgi:hypothetical protein
VPAGAEVTILSWSASYATKVGLTVILGLIFSKSLIIEATSDSEYPACFMNRALIVPVLPPTAPPVVGAPVMLHPETIRAATAATPTPPMARRARVLLNFMWSSIGSV